jgi:hypothetical protein
MVQEKARGGVGGGEGIAGRFSSPDLQSQSRPTSTGSKAGAIHSFLFYFVLCTFYCVLSTLYFVLCTCWLTRNGPDRAAQRVSIECMVYNLYLLDPVPLSLLEFEISEGRNSAFSLSPLLLNHTV